MQEIINILLVDDESRNLDILDAILSDPGYRLLRADNADTALRTLLENDVAAIVLDIKMPNVSGFELAQLIKGTKKFRQIPIVFLTAYLVDDKDVITGYGAGAVDYLTKPVNPEILRHKLSVFAELFRKTRALAELNENLESRVQERTLKLEKSEAALREANEQKDRFLATLAHELRNPLAPLRTGLDILLGESEQTPTAAHTLALMNRQVDHMVRLIDDLLDVSRISRGTLEMRKKHVDLAEVIEHALETMRPALVRRKQSAEVRAEVPVTAMVDATRVAQIVGNLVNNASKHSAIGASIQVVLRLEGDDATIQVIDDGVGIAPDQLARVFEMFTKIERSLPGTNDGLGIGLALSRQLAELHGGSLRAASAGEGKGAAFTLTVPVGIAENAGANATGESKAPPVTTSKLSIVVIEDNEDAAEMLATWLTGLGHQVKVAHTGPAGVALVVEVRPDVVLCDVGLPELSGTEVCRQIVAAVTPTPLMIALTGWGMEEDRRRTAEAGVRHHLVKPVDLEKLRAILSDVGRRP